MDSSAILMMWISVALIFLAGTLSGIVIAIAWTRLSAPHKNRHDLAAVRQRILAGIRESHNEEILHEAFRATEDLRSELFKSLNGLRASMNLVLTPALHTGQKQQPTAAEAALSAGAPTGTGSN